jgi:hypothetical protein
VAVIRSEPSGKRTLPVIQPSDSRVCRIPREKS